MHDCMIHCVSRCKKPWERVCCCGSFFERQRRPFNRPARSTAVVLVFVFGRARFLFLFFSLGENFTCMYNYTGCIQRIYSDVAKRPISLRLRRPFSSNAPGTLQRIHYNRTYRHDNGGYRSSTFCSGGILQQCTTILKDTAMHDIPAGSTHTQANWQYPNIRYDTKLRLVYGTVRCDSQLVDLERDLRWQLVKHKFARDSVEAFGYWMAWASNLGRDLLFVIDEMWAVGYWIAWVSSLGRGNLFVIMTKWRNVPGLRFLIPFVCLFVCSTGLEMGCHSGVSRFFFFVALYTLRRVVPPPWLCAKFSNSGCQGTK